MSENESTSCSPALISLRNWLKEQIADEQKANRDYADASLKLAKIANEFMKETWSTQYQYRKFGADLRKISDQEMSHKIALETMVDYITRQCKLPKELKR